MGSIFKRTLKSAIYNPAAERLMSWMHRHKPRILTYHSFPKTQVENFARQCEHLRRYYNPVSMDEVVAFVRDLKPLPPRSVAITIDDGYRDVYEFGAPVLRRFHIPATLYAVPAFLDRQCWLWWDCISYALFHSPLNQAQLIVPGNELSPATFALGSVAQRQALATHISISLSRFDDQSRWVQDFAQRLQVNLPETPVPPYDAISWEQTRELAANGFAIGSHTMNHRVTGTLHDPDVKRFEINGSRERLEAMLHRPVHHFSFPNGGIGDFSHTDIELVKQAGYSSAVTTLIGMLDDEADCFQLPRINAGADMDLSFFKMRLAGLFQYTHATNIPVRVSGD